MRLIPASFTASGDARPSPRDGTTNVTLNQQVNGGRWNLLGEFEMAPSSGHKVVVDDTGADSTVIADAVRFVRIGDARRVVADAIKIVPNTAEDALYVHANHLGAPQKMTDSSAAIVWDAAFTPFGIEDSIAGTATNNQRFPGQYADAVTGLHYNWHRHYDPGTGRYITSDPIGLAGGLNTYGYVGGNPVMYVDPEGKAAALVAAALGIGARALANSAARAAAFKLGNALGQALYCLLWPAITPRPLADRPPVPIPPEPMRSDGGSDRQDTDAAKRPIPDTHTVRHQTGRMIPNMET